MVDLGVEHRLLRPRLSLSGLEETQKNEGKTIKMDKKTQLVLGLLTAMVLSVFAAPSADAAPITVKASDVLTQTSFKLTETGGNYMFSWDILGNDSMDGSGINKSSKCFSIWEAASLTGYNSLARITRGDTAGSDDYKLYQSGMVRGNSGASGVDYIPNSYRSDLWYSVNRYGSVEGDDNFMPFMIPTGRHGFANNVYGFVQFKLGLPGSYSSPNGRNGTVEILGWTYDPAGLPVAVTPEPATMSMLALGGLAMLKRRRRKA